MTVRAQSSSLWARLLTLPLRVLLVLNFVSDKGSGVLVLLFIIVFVGGLLVLLVSVASSVYQEQGVSARILGLGILFIGVYRVLPQASSYEWNIDLLSIFSWNEEVEKVYFYLRIIYLLTSLSILSVLFGEFKGAIRKL